MQINPMTHNDRAAPHLSRRCLLAGIFVIALTVRMGYNLWWVGLNDIPTQDAADYHQIAIHISETGTNNHLGRAPLFPALLAGAYTLFGVHPFAGRILLSLIGAATCLLVYLLGRECFNERVGFLASAGATIYVMLFQWDGYLLTETLFIFLHTLFLWLTLRARGHSSWRYPALGGLTLGLATLARPTTLIFFPFILIWALITFYPRWKTALAKTGVIIGVMAFTLTPWTIRNYFVTGGSIVPVTVMGGYILLGSNNPHVLDDFGSGWIPAYKSGLVTEQDLEGLSPVERDRLYQSRAIAFMKDNPVYVLRAGFYKLKLFWHLHRAVDPASLQYILVAASALFGVWHTRKRWRDLSLLYIVPFFFTLVAFIFWGDDRIRSPLEPILLVFAAWSWLRIIEAVRNRYIRPSTSPASGVAG